MPRTDQFEKQRQIEAARTHGREVMAANANYGHGGRPGQRGGSAPKGSMAEHVNKAGEAAEAARHSGWRGDGEVGSHAFEASKYANRATVMAKQNPDSKVLSLDAAAANRSAASAHHTASQSNFSESLEAKAHQSLEQHHNAVADELEKSASPRPTNKQITDALMDQGDVRHRPK